MKKKSILAKAGFWVNERLNLLEILSVALLFIALLVYNYTDLRYNQLIIIPLVALALVYYLASFAFNLTEKNNVLEMVTAKLVYLFASIGFLGIALEYVENPGARLMLLIGGIASLVLLLIMLISRILKKAYFTAELMIRSFVFVLVFSLIYLIAYGLIV